MCNLSKNKIRKFKAFSFSIFLIYNLPKKSKITKIFANTYFLFNQLWTKALKLAGCWSSYLWIQCLCFFFQSLISCKLETFCYDFKCESEILKKWKTSLHHLQIVTNDSFGSQIFPNVKSVSICSTTPANLVSLETIFPAATQFYLCYRGPSERWTNVSQIMHDIQLHHTNVKIACYRRESKDFWVSRWSSRDRNKFRKKGITKPKAFVSLKKKYK